MLKTRALVAVIALPILVALILWGSWAFAITVLVAMLLAGDEYVRLLRQGSYQPNELLVLALIALPVAAVWFEEPAWLEPGLTAGLLVGLWIIVWERQHERPNAFINVVLAVFGGVYFGWLGSRLLAIRQFDDRAYLKLLVYGMVITSDSAAYFAGRQWGRHKLASNVSPKKTWEGYIAGAISGPILGAIVAASYGGPLSVGLAAILGLLIGALGTVGDLGISAIKRQVGAKDSSHLIPGHGGILDRTDSVLVAAAIGYYFVKWFV